MTRDFSPMPSPSNAPEAVTDIVDMINPRQIMRSAIVGGVSFIFYSLSVVDKHFLTFMFTMDIQINLK